MGDDDGYHTLDSGDDLDKIAAKKLERKKRRKQERGKNKVGVLAEAAGFGLDEDEDDEDLPEEMLPPEEIRHEISEEDERVGMRRRTKLRKRRTKMDERRDGYGDRRPRLLQGAGRNHTTFV
mmetsp:Transcript_14834/g.32276  ORF Transcript_14834/g.32276 Transcript_14834/m.32276 type:complete len:122 (+) Transcript_14834:2275-2640(+)